MPLTQYYTATTIDGFIADEDNSLEWLFAPRAATTRHSGGTRSSAGSARWPWARRRTSGCSGTRTCWTTPSGGAASTATGRAGCSRTATCPASRVPTSGSCRGDVPPVHAAMREAAGDGNIWVVGGGDLVGQFHDAGLLDQVGRRHRAGDARGRRPAAAAPDRGAAAGRGAPGRPDGQPDLRRPPTRLTRARLRPARAAGAGRREHDDDRVPGAHLAAPPYDAHHAGPAHDGAVGVAGQHLPQQPALEVVDLPARVAQPGDTTSAASPSSSTVPVGSASRSTPLVVTFSPSSPGSTRCPAPSTSSNSSAGTGAPGAGSAASGRDAPASGAARSPRGARRPPPRAPRPRRITGPALLGDRCCAAGCDGGDPWGARCGRGRRIWRDPVRHRGAWH